MESAALFEENFLGHFNLVVGGANLRRWRIRNLSSARIPGNLASIARGFMFAVKERKQIESSHKSL